jgi:hypothetical protein
LNGVEYSHTPTLSFGKLSHHSDRFEAQPDQGIYDLYFERHSKFWSKVPNSLLVSASLKKRRRRWQPVNHGNFNNSLNFGSDLPDGIQAQVVYYLDQLPYLDYTEMPMYIRLVPYIQKKLDTSARVMDLKNAVGIHIRSTDKRPTSDIQKLIAHIRSRHTSSLIYLSTDSVEIEELILKALGNVILFEKTKPALRGEGLHQWALRNERNDMKYKLYEESVMEMFLLSKCEYLYYQGNSTFSNISKVYHPAKANCYDWLRL